MLTDATLVRPLPFYSYDDLNVQPAYYPGNSLNQMVAFENTRWEDFDYTYLDELNGNPMGWLGNGYTLADYDASSRTTYLDPANIDYPPVPPPPKAQKMEVDQNHKVKEEKLAPLAHVVELERATMVR